MLVIRDSREEDIEKIYIHLNQSYVQKYFKNQESDEKKRYEKWYKHLINSSDCVMFTIEDKKRNFLGIVKFMLNKNFREAEVFIHLDKKIRGKGYSAKIVTLAIEEIKFKKTTLKRIIAHILEENKASIHCFKKVGFRFLGSEIDYSLYSKEID